MSELLIRWVSVFFLFAISPLRLSSQSIQANKPIPVKVVVVAMFERGEDTGDTPGEYQLWVEREHLDQILPLPAGYHHVRLNKDGVLGILTGVGTAKAAASVMAVGLDPRFDLSKAYWLVAGIGGGDPADVSLGSAVWADHVLDGDLAYEIDARQIPENWPTGYVPLRKASPYEQPVRDQLEGELYTLGKGNYMIAALEDTGTMQALTFLSQAGRVDLRRVLVLRAVSNYDREPPGTNVPDSLKTMVSGNYSAYFPALEAAQIVGDKVVRDIVEHWSERATTIPH